MADNDDSQVPLVTNSIIGETPSDENKDNNNSNNVTDGEPLITNENKNTSDDTTTTITTTTTKTKTPDKTQEQLRNAIALSPKTTSDNKEEAFISGLGPNTDKTSNILSIEGGSNNNNDDDDDDEDNSNKMSQLELEVSCLREKITKLNENPVNIFSKHFTNSLLNLGNRQRRAREQERERNKSRELNIKEQKVLRGHFGKVYCIDFSNDSEEIVSCSQDGKILIWNVMSTHKRVAIPLMTAWTMTCCWSNDSEMIACGGLDNTISIYRIKRDTTGWESKRPFIELLDHEGYISDLQFINNSGQLVSSSGDASVILFDIEKECGISSYQHEGDVMSLSVYDNNLLLTGSTDGSAKIWDLRIGGSQKNESGTSKTSGTSETESDNRNKIFQGECIYEFRGNSVSSSDINSVSWFPDGKAFVIGCDDSHCRLFDLRTQCQLISYYDSENTCNVTNVDVSKSGKYVYTTYDNDPWCNVWETSTGDKKQTIVHPSRPACLKVAPNGFSLATGCWDNKIRIWSP